MAIDYWTKVDAEPAGASSRPRTGRTNDPAPHPTEALEVV